MNRKDFLKATAGGLAGLFVFPGALVASNDSYANLRDGEIFLPGQGAVKIEDSIIPGGHFTWAEATANGKRIPNQKENEIYKMREGIVLPCPEEIVYNIRRVAEIVENVREKFGNRPIKVNSWHRPPLVNSSTEGASRKSRHMYGDAIDFQIRGVHPYSVYDFLDKYIGNSGGVGKYYKFTHMDIRGNKARWRGG
jgi:uncharacterized protein YcbK (DUF882 family)